MKKDQLFGRRQPNGDRYINENTNYNIQIMKDGFHEDKNGSQIPQQSIWIMEEALSWK